MHTKISVSRQALVDANIDWQANKIVNLNDPENDMDAVNLRTLTAAINDATGGGGTVGIGAAEDGDYTDGLFTDFITTTPVGTAVDRFNEVLKSLSPQPAPSFSSISCADSGVSGKLSFGSSNAVAGYTNHPTINAGGAYSASGTRRGIFNANTTINGVLADNNTANNPDGRPYPNNSFGDGDSGSLHLVVNGVTVQSVDLSTFGSGNSLNANGSGFNLSAASPVEFNNGDPFDVFKYRTGTWTVNPSDQTPGYNTVQVRHEYAAGLFRDSETFEWVVDDSVTNTSYANEALSSLVMTGSRHISGVEYNTGGTAQYAVDISNAFRNTYSSSSSALNFGGTNISVSDEALPAFINEGSNVNITGKTFTVNATRLLNGAITANVKTDRTVQSDITSSGDSISGLFVDSTSDNSTTSLIRFNGESRRIHAGLDIESVAYTSTNSPAIWDSLQDLISGNANHNTGLLVFNGKLQYPDINFSNFASNGPAGNPDYSGATGNRTFIGFFYNALAYSNFAFNVNGSGISFVPVSTGPSGNNLTFEVLAPNTTVNGGGSVEWKDAVVPHSGNDTDIGCYASTYGNSIPTNWGCTIGTKNTSTSGFVIVVRVTASAAWTGYLNSIGITWI